MIKNISELQRVVFRLCLRNPPDYCTFQSLILEQYFGKYGGIDKSRKNSVQRSLRTLRDKNLIKVGRKRINDKICLTFEGLKQVRKFIEKEE